MLGLLLTLLADPLDVAWTAPPACPQSDAVQAAVAANLAREDFGEALEDVSVTGAVVADPAGWRLSVAVQMPEGTVDRELTAGSCDELAAAAGLIIAVALDPLRVQRLRPKPPPKPVHDDLPEAWVNPPPPPPKPERLEPEPDPPAPAATPSLDLDLRIAGLLGGGSLPTVRGGASAGLGVVGRWFRADATAVYWAPRSIRGFSGRPDAGARIQQAGIGARACLDPRLGAWEPAVCAGMEGGLAWGRGLGVERPQTTTLPWLSALAGLEVAWVPGRVGAFAGLDTLVNLVRPRVRLDGLGQALEIAPVGVRAQLGLLVRW